MAALYPASPNPAGASTAPRATTGRHPSPTRRLISAELRLLRRDPVTVSFVFLLPIVSMLIIGGSFGRTPDDVFPVDPAHWYVASYFAVVIGSMGLITLPVHIATYRERGVLRRLAASGFPRWSFAVAELALGLSAVAVAGVVLLVVALPVYGVPAASDPVRLLAGIVTSAVAFIGIGVVLGTMLPSARAAQAVGLALFFPSFLLGGGGPPPAVMSPTLASVADMLPLSLAIESIRNPWLGLGGATPALVAMGLIAVLAGVFAARRASL